MVLNENGVGDVQQPLPCLYHCWMASDSCHWFPCVMFTENYLSESVSNTYRIVTVLVSGCTRLDGSGLSESKARAQHV